jgi:hypothetical protein
VCCKSVYSYISCKETHTSTISKFQLYIYVFTDNFVIRGLRWLRGCGFYGRDDEIRQQFSKEFFRYFSLIFIFCVRTEKEWLLEDRFTTFRGCLTI